MRQKIKNNFLYLSILILITLVFLSSCNNSSNKPQETSQQAPQTESTGQIVDKYVNTLTTAQDKAKQAAGAENKRMEEESKAAHEMEKP